MYPIGYIVYSSKYIFKTIHYAFSPLEQRYCCLGNSVLLCLFIGQLNGSIS